VGLTLERGCLLEMVLHLTVCLAAQQYWLFSLGMLIRGHSIEGALCAWGTVEGLLSEFCHVHARVCVP